MIMGFSKYMGMPCDMFEKENPKGLAQVAQVVRALVFVVVHEV
jgi:hypothetical protein